MSEIDTPEQIGHRHRRFLGTAAITVATARLVMIAAAATLVITSPAFARQHAAHPKSLSALTPSPRSQVTIDRNDPALTGGGSLGYNQRVEHGY